LTKGYPMLTPYQFASNTPIAAIDLDGLEALIVVSGEYWKGRIQEAVTNKDVEYATFLAFEAVSKTLEDLPNDDARNWALGKGGWQGNSPAILNYKDHSGLIVKTEDGTTLFRIENTSPKDDVHNASWLDRIVDWLGWGEGLKGGGGYAFFTSNKDAVGTPIGHVRSGKADGFIDIDLLMKAIGASSSAAGNSSVPFPGKSVKDVLQGVKQILDAYQTGSDVGDALGIEDNKKPKSSGSNKLTCPTCKQEQDSTHIDQINGPGTYGKVKQEQKTKKD
jgi:hypothetical protein